MMEKGSQLKRTAAAIVSSKNDGGESLIFKIFFQHQKFSNIS